ncbi:MAG: SH3 domain-containing protein [Aggregatilineales bacterium]
MLRHSRIRSIIVFVLLSCLLWVGVAQAQVATPIAIGENRTGEIGQPGAVAEFSLLTPSAVAANVQVLAISQGLAPAFEVVAPPGIIIASDPNVSGSGISSAAVNLSPGSYLIRVRSAVNSTGQFLISVQGGAPLAPPQPLLLGQTVSGQVSAQASRQAYSFRGQIGEILLLTVDGPRLAPGPVVTLKDADTGDTLAINSGRLIGIRHRLPDEVANYLLEIAHSGGPQTEGYTICLETESPAARCAAPIPTLAAQVPTAVPPTAVVPTQPVQIPPAGPCSVASLTGSSVNVRSGPGLNFGILTVLGPTTIAPVIGRLPDNSWYQINLNGQIGWVSLAVVRVGGNCAGVAIVQPPTPIPLTATLATVPTATLIATPTDTPTATPTVTPPPLPMPTLNFSLPPIYGSVALSSGFVSDPYSVNVASGGPVNVSYLGGGCTGFATSQPTFSVNYTTGGFTLLRFYFIGAGDTSMVVNAPNGAYFCNDDSFGTLNPTLDFNSPASGRYDIWIGSFFEGDSINGTLYVTEISANHP